MLYMGFLMQQVFHSCSGFFHFNYSYLIQNFCVKIYFHVVVIRAALPILFILSSCRGTEEVF